MPAPIIIDTDPGIDDAIALIVAARAPSAIELTAVTTVGGNVGGDITFNNARRLIEWLDHSAPVIAGCPAPFLKTFENAENIHGADGFGGVQLPAPVRTADPRHAAPYLIEACKAAASKGERLILCPIGPLTNIAAALVMAPDIADGIDKIVLMGGAAEAEGNVTPYAEFNVWADPHSAEVVFRAPVEKVMIGLDVTEVTPASDEWVDSLKLLDDTVGGFAMDILNNYHSRNRALHDPCVVAYLINPDLFEGRRAKIHVDMTEGEESGRTHAKWDDGGDTLVLMKVNAEGVRSVVGDAIAGRFL